MSGALARRPAGALAGARPEAMTFAEMLRRAEVLSKTELVPKSLQGRPEAIALVGALGAELGVPFTTSLGQIDVIENRPDPSAQLRLALIRRAGHEVKWGETSSERAEIRGRRREHRRDPDGWSSIVWTLDDARRAGLLDLTVERWTSVNGKNRKETFLVGDDRGIFTAEERARRGLPRELPEWATKELDAGSVKRKDNWQKYPAEMLRARAAKALSRMLFSDVLAAMHVPDIDVDSELDIDEPDFSKATPPPESEVEEDDVVDAEIVDEDEDEPITAPGRDGPSAGEVLVSDELAGDLQPSCPVAGCTIEGEHKHDPWIEKKAAEQAAGEDPATWDGERWRSELADRGMSPAAALKEARRLACEHDGYDLPASFEDLQSSELGRVLLQRPRS